MDGFSADLAAAYVSSNVTLPPAVDSRLNAPGISGTNFPQCPLLGPTGRCYDYTVNIRTRSGGPNIYSPTWTVNGGVQYDFPIGNADTITPRVDFSYMGKQFTNYFRNPAQFPTDVLASRFLTNAKLSYAHENWLLVIYGTNIFNQIYFSGTGFYAKPRQYGARLSWNF